MYLQMLPERVCGQESSLLNNHMQLFNTNGDILPPSCYRTKFGS